MTAPLNRLSPFRLQEKSGPQHASSKDLKAPKEFKIGMMSKLGFSVRVGLNKIAYKAQSLGARMGGKAGINSSRKSKAPGKSSPALDEDDDDDSVDALFASWQGGAGKDESESTGEDRGKDRRAEMEQTLKNFDSSQHYGLLQKTLLKGADEKLSPSEREDFSATLKSMMTDAYKNNPEGVRGNLLKPSASAKLDGAKDVSDSTLEKSRRQRFSYGSSQPTAGLGLIEARYFLKSQIKACDGYEAVPEAINLLRPLLVAGLGKRNQSMVQNAMAMSDAVACTTVQTMIASGADLRRELAKQTKILSPHPPARIAEVLFEAIDLGWGKGTAGKLVNHIANLDHEDPLQSAIACKLIFNAVHDLPPLMWSQDKQLSRLDLLDDLKQMVDDKYAMVPQLHIQEEQREQEWKDTMTG